MVSIIAEPKHGEALCVFEALSSLIVRQQWDKKDKNENLKI